MARSYKRGWICDRNPWAKNYANRCLRRQHWSREIPNGKSYRKFRNPWDICDWRWKAKHPRDEVHLLTIANSPWYAEYYFKIMKQERGSIPSSICDAQR